MTPTKIPFTDVAYSALQIEKTRLFALRKEVLVRLKDAREQGDLSENGAYKYAKFELGNIGRQLRDVNYKLLHGFVPKIATTQHVNFGHTVTLKSGQKNMRFKLVSEFESNPAENKLSITSPIGSAIMGKNIGDVVSVTTPVGVKQFEVVAIEL